MEHLQELKKREDEAHDLSLMTSNLLEREIERHSTISLEQAKRDEVGRVLDAVDEEMWKRRQMFDYEGKPTKNESECTLSNLKITSQRWAEVMQALKEEK